MARLRKERRHAAHTNDSWAVDFGHDRLATGRIYGGIRMGAC
ncbi:hypothetical protein [Gluconobacter sp. GP1]|nr:hypothetical protein [Gluconobacter sp. GP1]